MVMLIIAGEYKEECGTCALIAEGSTMPYSDNTCPQVTFCNAVPSNK